MGHISSNRGFLTLKILICVNGQKYARSALGFAADLLKSVSAEVTLLFVEHPLATSAPKAAFDFVQKGPVPSPWTMQTKIVKGDLSEQITAELRKGKHDLLILGSLSPGDLLDPNKEMSYLKDTEEKLLRTCQTSLLVVKNPRPLYKVLICTDGSKMALGAIHFFGKLQLSPPPRINIVNVVPEIYTRFADMLAPVGEELRDALATLPGKRTAYLYQAKEILAGYKLDAKVKLREGDASEEILTEAKNDYDLVVMGMGGRKADVKETLGRQTRRVIRAASAPVLAIRNTGT